MTPGLVLAAKVGAVALAAGTAVGITWAVTDEDAPGTPAGARAWFDEPLHGAELPAVQVPVVAHATDADGVAEIVLFVDGEEYASESFDRADRIVTWETTWDAESGEHTLEVEGRDGGGTAGVRAAVDVTVTEDDGPPVTTGPRGTTVPGATTTSTTSTTTTTVPGATTAPPGATTAPPVTTIPGTSPPTTPTTRPCSTPAPTLVDPDDGADTGRSPTLIWDYSGCPVQGFNAELSLDPAMVDAEYSADLGPGARSWSPGELACATWYWRVGTVANRPPIIWSAPRSFKTC